jgi:hypothetical protein
MQDGLTNLLKETLEVLLNHGKSTIDVLWVGNSVVSGSWPEFAALAANVDYDSGFGEAEIPSDLVVVGSDWWLERGEYDGSEWWEYKTLPVRSTTQVESFSIKLIEG